LVVVVAYALFVHTWPTEAPLNERNAPPNAKRKLDQIQAEARAKVQSV